MLNVTRQAVHDATKTWGYLLAMDMGRQSKWEYFRTVFARYRRADRGTKQKMLDEFCPNTGYHRKHALRPLNGPPPVECGSSSYRLSTAFGTAEYITVIATVSALPGTGTSKGGSCCYRTPKRGLAMLAFFS